MQHQVAPCSATVNTSAATSLLWGPVHVIASHSAQRGFFIHVRLAGQPQVRQLQQSGLYKAVGALFAGCWALFAGAPLQSWHDVRVYIHVYMPCGAWSTFRCRPAIRMVPPHMQMPSGAVNTTIDLTLRNVYRLQ